MRELPLPQITIQQLDYLVAVANHASWAEAASSVGVSPSALSQGLAELERRLGLELFERVGRRRIVAPGSQAVVDYARRVLADTGDLARWADRTTSGQAGSLRVGMIDAAAIGHYGETLRTLREDQPDIDFMLTVAPSGELLRSLAEGDLDLAVVVRPETLPLGVEWTEVLKEPLGVYAPPGTDVGPPSTWGPWVSFNEASHTRHLVAEALNAIGAPFNVVAESNQPDVLKEMVRLGMGWTVLPVIQAELEPTALRPALAEAIAVRTLVAAKRHHAVENPLASGLVDRLVGVAGA